MKRICLASILLLLLCSCELLPKTSGAWSPNKDSVDPVNTVLQFSDIPTPTEFKLDSKASFSREKGTARFGKLVYYGNMDLNELENFMVDQLDFQQWKLLSKTLRDGESTLFFQKGTEELQLYLRSSGGWKTRLEVIIG